MGHLNSPTHNFRSFFYYTHPNVSSSSTFYLTLQLCNFLSCTMTFWNWIACRFLPWHDAETGHFFLFHVFLGIHSMSIYALLLHLRQILCCVAFVNANEKCQSKNYTFSLKLLLGGNKWDVKNKLTSIILLLAPPNPQPKIGRSLEITVAT